MNAGQVKAFGILSGAPLALLLLLFVQNNHNFGYSMSTSSQSTCFVKSSCVLSFDCPNIEICSKTFPFQYITYILTGCEVASLLWTLAVGKMSFRFSSFSQCPEPTFTKILINNLECKFVSSKGFACEECT